MKNSKRKRNLGVFKWQFHPPPKLSLKCLWLPEQESFQDEGHDDGHHDHGEQVEAHKI